MKKKGQKEFRLLECPKEKRRRMEEYGVFFYSSLFLNFFTLKLRTTTV